MPAVQAVRSEDFVQSIGVNQHIAWTGTPYANLAIAEQDLAYLGVDNVRDAAPYSGDLADYQSMAAKGIKFDLLVSSAGQDVAAVLSGDLAEIDQLARSNPGSVLSIEGPNELNAANGVTYNGVSASDPNAYVADQIMSAVYSAVHSDPTLAGVSVVNVSLNNGIPNWQTYLADLGNMSSSVDSGNWHVYFVGGVQPAANVASMLANAKQAAPGKPVVFTEAGYFTASQDASGWGGVDEKVQMDNTLNLLADAYKAGVSHTYLYELMDGVANPSLTDIEDSFGLFTADGAPKPVATAIHNLTSILADPAKNAQNFTPGSLNYSINNLPTMGNSLLMEKSSGAFDLMVWNEAPDWNPATDTEIAVATTNVTVQLGGTYQTVEVFDPTRGSGPIQTLTNVSTVTLGLTDHPMIIEIEPNKASPATGSSTSSGSTTSSGSATSSNPSAPSITLSNQSGQTFSIDPTQPKTVIDGDAKFILTAANNAVVMLGAATDHLNFIGLTSVRLAAGSGNDTVKVDVGANTFIAGTGRLDVTGGSGVDKYMFQANSGTLKIENFAAAQGDTLFVSKILQNSMIEQSDGNGGTLLTFDGSTQQSIDLVGITSFDTSKIGFVRPADTLILKMSEDAYQGNAQFTVSIDGNQIGGTQTVTTLHGSGSQAFTFSGYFGVGTHTVSVNFLNDAWAPTGPANGDRNLYVDSASYDGFSAPSVATELYANGTANLTVGVTPTITMSNKAGQNFTINATSAQTLTDGDAHFTLTGAGNASVVLGTATDKLSFIGMAAVTLTSGAGSDTVTSADGTNIFTAGSGSLDVTGGRGIDSYLYQGTSGSLRIEDFSAAKGDGLFVSKSLQATMHEQTDNHGGTLLTFGASGNHSIDIIGVPTFDTSLIHFR